MLNQLIDYLRGYKKQRAQLLLDSYIYLTPRNGWYTEDLARRRTEFEHQLLAIKPEVYRVDEPRADYRLYQTTNG